MNIKIGFGIAVAVLILAASFFFFRPATAPTTEGIVQQGAATTTGAQPTFIVGTTTKKSVFSVRFDPQSLVSTSAYPTITGTANVSKIAIVINNSEGVGIVGAADIPVVKGRWSYSDSVALVPGTYHVIVAGEDAAVTATLVVKNPQQTE